MTEWKSCFEFLIKGTTKASKTRLEDENQESSLLVFFIIIIGHSAALLVFVFFECLQYFVMNRKRIEKPFMAMKNFNVLACISNMMKVLRLK